MGGKISHVVSYPASWDLLSSWRFSINKLGADWFHLLKQQLLKCDIEKKMSAGTEHFDYINLLDLNQGCVISRNTYWLDRDLRNLLDITSDQQINLLRPPHIVDLNKCDMCGWMFQGKKYVKRVYVKYINTDYKLIWEKYQRVIN